MCYRNHGFLQLIFLILRKNNLQVFKRIKFNLILRRELKIIPFHKKCLYENADLNIED